MEATSGDQRPPSDAVDVRITAWRPSGATETVDVAGLAAILAEPDTKVWVDAIDPSAEHIGPIAEALGLHPLIAEDIVERNQRAKVETFDDIVHIVLFELSYGGDVDCRNRLRPRAPVPPQRPRPGVRPAIDRADAGGRRADPEEGHRLPPVPPGRSRRRRLLPGARSLAEEIDELQDRVLASPSDWTLQRLFVLKRELLAIRRATSPAREIFNQLTNREVAAVEESHVVYFRDVYDHLIRVTDELDNYRELVGGTLDIYLSTINNNLSRIMKRLTGVTVIVAGIGAVGGIFGMSQATPALAGQEGFGFWFVTVASIVAASVVTIVLRRIDWI